jgi:hypothetical protein
MTKTAKTKSSRQKPQASKGKASKPAAAKLAMKGRKPKPSAAGDGSAPSSGAPTETPAHRERQGRAVGEAPVALAEPTTGPAPSDQPAPQTDSAAAAELAPIAASPTEAPVVESNESTPLGPEDVAPKPERPEATNSRLPPVGTVIEKRDRRGAVRCACEVTEKGVRYRGTLYTSLSAAAVAAAKDLGLAAKAINGFTFWGLAKPARPAADPLAALERAWDRYASRVESALEGAKASEEGREPVLSALQRHGRVLKNLHDEVA